LTNEIVVITEA